MKQTRRLLSVLIALVMLAGMCTLGFSAGAANYQVGETIQFGTYPQTEVKDSKLIAKLAEVEKIWNSYDYYTGTGSWIDGEMEPSDYMQYADFSLDGAKYRAVMFTLYRPTTTGSKATVSSGQGTGYVTDIIYYFRYEPIEWIVLSANNGLLLSKKVLDAQAYQNVVSVRNGTSYGSKTSTTYANNYPASSIRSFLNNDLYDVAFSDSQRSAMRKYNLSCAPYGSSSSSPSVNDNVFLLSYDECMNTAYGFKNDFNADKARVASAVTDYARCQGLNVTDSGAAEWWLRTPGTSSGQTSCVTDVGGLSNSMTVNKISKGVRPAIFVPGLQTNTELRACPHTGEKTVYTEVKPTCTEPGHAAYTICNACSAIVSGSNAVLPATDHVDKEGGQDGWCDVCGDEIYVHLDGSGSLQLSAPFQRIVDMIRRLVERIDSLFNKLENPDPSDAFVKTPISNLADSIVGPLSGMVSVFNDMISSAESEEKEPSFGDRLLGFITNFGN